LVDELILEFIQDSELLIRDLKDNLTSFNEINSETNFEEYGQKVDRIMGAAFTLSLYEIAELCRLSKELSYKSISVKEKGKLIVIHGLLSQAFKLLALSLILLKKEISLPKEEVDALLQKMRLASTKLGELQTTTNR
jgi:hypothetical protein